MATLSVDDALVVDEVAAVLAVSVAVAVVLPEAVVEEAPVAPTEAKALKIADSRSPPGGWDDVDDTPVVLVSSLSSLPSVLCERMFDRADKGMDSPLLEMDVTLI